LTEERIAIVTDGSLSTDSNFATKVLPFYVILYPEKDSGKIRSLRQDEITVEEFLLCQAAAKKLPGTSQPTPNDFLEVFESLASEDYTHVLVLTVPVSKSGTYNSARIALLNFEESYGKDKLVVELIDTGTTAGGVEYLASEALQLINQGKSFDYIVHQIKRLTAKIELFLALDKIDYISSSGRITDLAPANFRETLKIRARNLAAWFAHKIHHSPKVVITMFDGKERIVKFSRFFRDMVLALADEIDNRVGDGKKIKKIYLYYSNSDEQVKELRFKLKALAIETEIKEVKTIPVALLAITGPKFVAMICIYD